MNFVSIDFETAASKRASACSIAITVVKNDQITDELYSLINPETEFNWRNVQVHGIHEEDVLDAPTFPELWPVIEPFFTPDKLVVAHNATFDNSVLKKTLERYHLNHLPYQTLDTLKTSRSFYPNYPNHKLNTLCDNLGINLQHHHNALDDSRACAELLIHEEQQFGVDAVKTFIHPVA